MKKETKDVEEEDLIKEMEHFDLIQMDILQLCAYRGKACGKIEMEFIEHLIDDLVEQRQQTKKKIEKIRGYE